MKTFVKSFGHLTFSLVIFFVILEGLYRWQIVDTYLPELRAFNTPESLSEEGRQTILVMGDSFTAGRTGYAGMLQQRLPHWRVVNAAVSGTGVIQAGVVAPRRFQKFHPSIFVYQVYVGNDLFDIRYPVNWQDTSLARNIYWMTANHLRSVGYINYRIGQILQPNVIGHPGAKAGDGTDSVLPVSFSVEQYEGRIKTYLKAEPALLEDSILVTGRRRSDYTVFLDNVERLISGCEALLCETYLLVIPHVCQVDERFIGHMQQLGARFTEPDRIRAVDYPFVRDLQDRFRRSPHVHVLNPVPALREANSQTPMYFANDEHLNPAGQKTIADFLAAQLHLQQ